MAFPFVAIMMLLTVIVEGHSFGKIRLKFEVDYLANVRALWLVVEEFIDVVIFGMDASFVKRGYIWN